MKRHLETSGAGMAMYQKLNPQQESNKDKTNGVNRFNRLGFGGVNDSLQFSWYHDNQKCLMMPKYLRPLLPTLKIYLEGFNSLVYRSVLVKIQTLLEEIPHLSVINLQTATSHPALWADVTIKGIRNEENTEVLRVESGSKYLQNGDWRYWTLKANIPFVRSIWGPEQFMSL